MNRHFRSAFSLVELSIVLIIIGLLVSGVSAGSKLISGAKLQRFIDEYSEIENAISLFNLTYGAYPGDFDEFDLFFGISNNGNNDGVIAAGEVTKIPQHLVEAGFISLVRDGSCLASEAITGSFCFRSHGANMYQLGISFVSINFMSPSGVWVSAISPRDAFKVDKKFDDGHAKKGNVIGWQYDVSGGYTCVTSGVYSSAGTETYKLDYDGVGCILLIGINNLMGI